MKGHIEGIKYASEIGIKGSRATKLGFNSTTKRGVDKILDKPVEAPGPGAYDLTFKDIIKMMDQKLAIRYQISPFGSGKPRFEEKTNRTVEAAPIKETMEISPGFSIKDKHVASDILNEHYKHKEKYRNSYTYASNVQRFKELYNNSVERAENESKNSEFKL